MRLNAMMLLLAVAAWLLAESQPGTVGARIEVRTTNSPVEIVGSDNDRVKVNDASRADISTSDGRMVVAGDKTGDTATIKLQVPRGSSLEVVTSNGAIRVTGVTGAMRLTTSNGPIIVRVAGGLNANLSASTSNGHIRADVPVAASRKGANFLQGKIGSGGPAIDLQTSNGDICLRNDNQQESVNSVFKPGAVQ